MQIELCGHATLASAHTLFSSGLVDTDVIEFVTLSGVLTAKKIPAINIISDSNLQKGEAKDGFYIEVNFPVDPVIEFNFEETSQISGALNGVSIIDIKKTQDGDDLFVIPVCSLRFLLLSSTHQPYLYYYCYYLFIVLFMDQSPYLLTCLIIEIRPVYISC